MKRISALLLALFMVAQLLVFTSSATTATHPHDNGAQVHCICGGSAAGVYDHGCAPAQWQPLPEGTTDFGTLPSGNYYLTADVQVTKASEIAANTKLSICLNGYNITSTNSRVFGYTLRGVELNICDCSGAESDGIWSFDGTVTAGAGSGKYGGVLYTKAMSRVNIFGGNFTGLSTTAVNGSVFIASNDNCDDYDGDGDVDETDKADPRAASTLCIYNGNIFASTSTTGSGGLISTFRNPHVRIHGGVISGGQAGASGGNIYCSGDLLITGGTITGGSTTTSGGNINCKAAATISGGVISGGTAQLNGGNIYAPGTLSITGGEIREGYSIYQGGNIYASNILNITGGTVTAGSSAQKVGGVFVSKTATAEISGTPVIDANQDGNLYFETGCTSTIGQLTQGAKVGILYTDVKHSVQVTHTPTADVLNYIYSDNQEAELTFSNTSMKLTAKAEEYMETISALNYFDNTPAEAVPMTAIYKLVMEHFEAELPEGKTEKKVILIGYDAFRTEATRLVTDQNSGILAVAQEGGLYHAFAGGIAGTAKQQRTVTGAGWSSIFTGYWADGHGVINNGYSINPGVYSYHTQLAEAGYEVCLLGEGMGKDTDENGAYINFFPARWANEVQYQEEKGLNVSYIDLVEPAANAAKMLQIVNAEDIPDVIWYYQYDPDHTGHIYGFGSHIDEYAAASKRVDENGYNIYQAIKNRPTYAQEDWLIIVATDHGGYLEEHGERTPQEVYTWFACNKPVDFAAYADYDRIEEEKVTQTGHTHCVCGGAAVGVYDHTCSSLEWQPLPQGTTDFGTLPSGNYYLTADVQVTKASDIAANTKLNICLNGHNITSSKTRVFGYTLRGSELSICDCSGEATDGVWTFDGTVTAGTGSGKYGGVLYTKAMSQVNIYGGNFTGLSTTAAQGSVFIAANDNCDDYDGDGDVDSTDATYPQAASTLSIYNGNIYGSVETTGSGGVIGSFGRPNIHIHGGVISGGRSGGAGGNVYSAGSLLLTGGTVTGGRAGTHGGNISTSGNTLTITGGTVTKGDAAECGDGVYIGRYVTANISGTPVIDGNDYGNLYFVAYCPATIGQLEEGARIGILYSAVWHKTEVTHAPKEDVLNYIYSDDPESQLTFNGTKLEQNALAQEYIDKVEQLNYFDNTLDDALPMTAVYKIVTDHFNSALPEGKTEKKVIVIGYDAFRTDTTQLMQDQNSGIFSVAADGGLYHSFAGGLLDTPKQQWTVTGTGWSSIFTGYWVDTHGVINNTYSINPGVYSYYTQLAEAGYEVCLLGEGMGKDTDENGAYINFFPARWSKEVQYQEEKDLGISYIDMTEPAANAEKMLQIVNAEDIPDVIWYYQYDPDHTGHASGFGPHVDEYVAASKRVDGNGYNVYQAIKNRPTYEQEDWLVIVTTDHGGHLEEHGRQTPQERCTWIACNKAIDYTKYLDYDRTEEEKQILDSHTHCVCGGSAMGVEDHVCEKIQWQPLSGTVNFGTLAAGNYYLSGDVTVSGAANIAAGTTLRICLNGHNITSTGSRVFGYVLANAQVDICDCSGTKDSAGEWHFDGTVTAGTGSGKYGGVLYTMSLGRANIYGGNFTSLSTTAETGAVLIASNDRSADYDADGTANTAKDKSDPRAASTLTIYNGNIYASVSVTGNGGVIGSFHNPKIRIYGGTISGGTAVNGGCISCTGDLLITGGKISGGTASASGGNIYTLTSTNHKSNVRIEGGTITGGSAKNGGNIYCTDEGILSGGLVTGGSATSYGGNVYCYGSLRLTDGQVTGGGGTNNGSNICNRGTLTVEGGFIGHAVKGIGVLTLSAGKTYIQGGTLTGLLQDGKTAQNVRVWDSGKLYISGGSFTDGEVYADKSAAIEISGGSFTGSTVKFALSSSAKGDGTLNISGGNIENLVLTDSNTTYDINVTLSGKTVIGKLERNGVLVSFTGLTKGASVLITKATEGTVFGSGDSVNYIYSDNGLVPALDGANLLWAQPKIVTVENGMTTGYASVQMAVEAQNGGYIKLLEDITEDVVISGEVHLDLNGKTLTGNITGDGTLYGMDSATDSYSADNMGRITGTVSCNVAGNFKTSLTGAVRRYMAISDDTGYTFHRFYMGITHINLKPGVTGVGYKAYFYGDEQVREQVTGYGYTLWVGDGEKLSAGKEGAFTSGKALALRLQNFDVAAYGEAPIYGQVYLTLKDGTTVDSAAHSYTLRNLVEQVAASADSYSESQLSALRDMLLRFESTVSGWNIDTIL